MKNLSTLVCDALFNLSPNSGANDEYRCGILVGVVSTLVGSGWTFGHAMRRIREYCSFHNIPLDDFTPKSWETCPPISTEVHLFGSYL